MNSVHLMGRISSDIVLRYSTEGLPICAFSIAVEEQYVTKQGERKKTTNFFEVTFFGARGETINKYFRKGSRILIDEAKLRQERWEDKTTGQKRSKVCVTGISFEFVDQRSQPDNQDQAHSQQPEQPAGEPETIEPNFDDDVPF